MSKLIGILCILILLGGCNTMPYGNRSAGTESNVVEQESDLEILTSTGCEVKTFERRGRVVKITCQQSK